MAIISSSEVEKAFPRALLSDARVAQALFREDIGYFHSNTFDVYVSGELVTLPARVYHDPSLIDTRQLTELQRELVCCILTRHYDGFIRQKYLERIIRSQHPWIPPFVIQLLGEYVIEILRVIQSHLGSLNLTVYGEFLRANPRFFALTEQRVISYWNLAYRDPEWPTPGPAYRWKDYVGSQLLEFFKAVAHAA